MANSDDPVWIALHVEAFGGEADEYVSVPRAEWDAMTEAQREERIQEETDEFLANHVSAGGVVVDADDVPPSCR